MDIEIELEELEEAIAFGCSVGPTIVCDSTGTECGPGGFLDCDT